MVMQNILLKHMDGSKYSKALLLVEPVPSDKLTHVENLYNQVITAVSSITASPQVLPAYMDWTSSTNPKSIFALPDGHALYDAAMSQFQAMLITLHMALTDSSLQNWDACLCIWQQLSGDLNFLWNL